MVISILGALFFALLSNFFFFHAFGVFGVFFILFLLLVYAILLYFQSLPKRTILGVLVGFLLFWGIAVTRSFQLIQTLSLGCGSFLVFLTVYLGASKKPFLTTVSELLISPLQFTVGYLETYFLKLPAFLFHFRKRDSQAWDTYAMMFGLTILGLVISLPVLFIIVGLLSHGDPIFRTLLINVLKHITVTDLVARLVGSLVVFLVLVPWGILHFVQKNHLVIPKSKLQIGIPVAVIQIVTTAALALFLVVAYPYIFANVASETSLSQFGVSTYSEYVKRGFTEFLLVSVVMYCVFWLGVIARRNKDAFSNRFLPFIQCFSTGIFGIFLFSIIRRILLYWSLHGLTLSRFYGGVFILWIAFLTIVVSLRIFQSKIRYVAVELVGSALLLLILGVFNSESFIVSHHPPTVNNRTDYVYLARLSPDGYEGWLQSLRFAEETISSLTQKEGILNADDRRQAGEAGMILAILSDHYHTFVGMYGSPQQQSGYWSSIARKENERILDTIRIFETYKNPKTRTPSTDYYIRGITGQYESTIGADFANKVANELNRMASKSADVAGQSGEIAKLSNTFPFSPRTPFTVAKFQGFCPVNVWVGANGQSDISLCVPSLYRYDMWERWTEKKPLDQFLTWHKNDIMVFGALQRDLPVESLLALQDKYIALWKRIIAQPENEHDYTLDVSYSSPFLEPLW